MKNTIRPLAFLFISLLHQASFANGVAIVDADLGIYFHLYRSEVDVRVDNQVAVTVTTQWFRNETNGTALFKYAFPMPAGCTATALRWQIGGVWYEASFTGTPQDTTLPGGGGPGGSTNNPLLTAYLGSTPLFFDIDNELSVDSTIAVELTYVQLLPYKFGKVTYDYPNNYELIQWTPLDLQRFTLNLESSRLIENLEMPDFPGALIVQGAYTGTLTEEIAGLPAALNYHVIYQLNADDLGLFSFSNFFPDSFGCDDYGKGFCAFIVEPAPEVDGDVINKVFTLIIDRSGSMVGDKIVQARDAASFIVNNLNLGDKFNIIDFSTTVHSVFPNHVDFSPATQAQALSFIASIIASGSTNISGAFGTAIPQFADDQDDTYNIIIFLTDGQATTGLTGTSEILQYVQQQIAFNEVKASIFCFGIGSDVNKQLLTLLANQNQGVATFLENDELQASITEFYLTVRNPVLLNTEMDFEPALVTETYPRPLPNLFKGVQMLVVGRYALPGETLAHFGGEAFGAPIAYEYTMNLTDADSAKYHFLPKLWAKQKTEYLLQQFYAAGSGAVADSLQGLIIDLSLCYGVITPFTSFNDDPGGGMVAIEEVEGNASTTKGPVVLMGITPNPAAGPVLIRYQVRQPLSGLLRFRILNPLGALVREWWMPVTGEEECQTSWDLRDGGGKVVGAGSYWLEIATSEGNVLGKIIVGK